MMTGKGFVKALETKVFTYGLNPNRNKKCVECGEIIPKGTVFLMSPNKQVLHQAGDCKQVAKLIYLSLK